MAWAQPKYSRAAVDRAGALLASDDFIDLGTDEEWSAAIDVINNWRSSHAFPLNTFQGTLRKKARLIDPNALVAQRTKRLVSIEAKLRNEPWLKLSQMQDIGGCRAIVASVAHVNALVASYAESDLKHTLLRRDDYLDSPRASGYRGIHLIYRYFSDKNQTYNGLRIEVQIRSNMQHAWATSVETVGTMLRQSLKASQGSDDWLRFFALMGTWMAVREGTERVADTPSKAKDLKKELREYTKKLDVRGRLRTYAQVIQLIEQPSVRRDRYREFTYFLLVLDPTSKSQQVRVIPYSIRDLEEATVEYARIEQEVRNKPGGEAVLVAVEQLGALRRAYPNYFLDTSSFLEEVARAIA